MTNTDQLIERSVNSLEHDILKIWFARIWKPFYDLLGDVDTISLQSRLKLAGISVCNALDGWTAPDAIWQCICMRDPDLASYPMGEITERAVKKIVAHLLVTQPWDGNLPGEDEVKTNLVKHIQDYGMDSLAILLAAFFLFEICVERLRQFSASLMLDTGYWYQFSADHRMIPTDLQVGMRRQIFEQCLRLAHGYSHKRSLKIPSAATIKVNVVVSGKPLSVLRRAYPVDDNPIRLVLHAKSTNVRLDGDLLAKELSNIRSKEFLNNGFYSKKPQKPELGSLANDFLDLGAVVYLTDIQIKRKSNLERELGILLPVRNLSRWDKARNDLEQAIAFLGRDKVKLYFMERKKTRGFAIPSSKASTNRCVCLFSGGIDGLAGAVWALEQGFAPVFVSHYASWMIGHLQKRLIESLSQIYKRDLPHVGIMIGKKSKKGVRYRLPYSPKSPMKQNLRAFMYLSIASTVAIELGIDRIFMFENGPMALNPIVSEARVNTRAVHPRLLELYNKLLNTVSGGKFQIENPFLYWTKGEVTKLLAKKGVSDLLAKTISCWKWFIVPPMAKMRNLEKPKGCFHDGECIPCLIRRASAHHAGLSDHDASYLYDVLKEFPVLSEETDPAFREVSTAIADYLRFNQLVLSYSNIGFLSEVPDFSLCINSVDCRRLVDTHRRQSKELLDFVRDGANAHFLDVFGAVVSKPT